jgi:hypothetical protein
MAAHSLTTPTLNEERKPVLELAQEGEVASLGYQSPYGSATLEGIKALDYIRDLVRGPRSVRLRYGCDSGA